MMTRIATQVIGAILRGVCPAPLVVNVSKILTVKGGLAIIYRAPMVSVIFPTAATQMTVLQPIVTAAKAYVAGK